MRNTPHPINPQIVRILGNTNCYNYIDGVDEPIETFLNEQLNEDPFIVEFDNKYSGNSLGWLLNEFENPDDPREFIECADDAPIYWRQVRSYSQFRKRFNGRTFVKIFFNGVGILIIKPTWFWKGPVPGTKIFKLVKDKPVKKFMTSYLLPEIRQGLDVNGIAHCNQDFKHPTPTYKLVEIMDDEISQIGGKKPINGGKKQRKRVRITYKKKKSRHCKTYKTYKTNKKRQ